MAITKDIQRDIAATSVVINNLFQESYKAGLGLNNNWVGPHVREFDTAKRAVDFVFYGNWNAPTQVGELQEYQYKEILGYLYELGMNEYQDGVQITKRDWLDDDLGILTSQVQALAEKYASIWRFLAVDILNNGATSAVQTYDGVPLYDNAHIVGAGTFDNLFAGTGTFADDLDTAYEFMELFVDDTNQVRDDNTPTHVVFHPSLRSEILTELESQGSTTDAKNSGVINPNFRLVSPIMEQKLSDANDWFLFKSAGSQVPFIGITNNAASATGNALVSTNKTNANGQITDKIFKWAIHQIKALHPTHPHLHAKVVNA